MRVYYAHSMKIYDTDREKDELKLIKSLYSNVVNPNGDIKWRGTMEDYFEAVRESDIVVCSEYKGHVGKGVHDEIKEAQLHDIPVFVIRRGKFYPVKEISIDNAGDWGVNYGRID